MEERGDVWNFKAMEANPFLEGRLPIPDSTFTIAELLKGTGYATALVECLHFVNCCISLHQKILMT